MHLDYDRFDPAPCRFPPPRVPSLPPLRPGQLGFPRAASPTPRRHYSRGRYALHAAYALAGVGERGSLLVPAYHSRTMVDPAVSLRAEVALYPVTPDLHVDADGLRRAAAACRTRPAALLVTHYFGLPREIASLAAWCRAEGIALIEDCSHALPGADPGDAGRPPIGDTGDWAISSPYKFFACPDGGWLWANGAAPLPPAPRGPGARAQLGGWLTAWRQWRARPAPPDAASVDAEIAALPPGAAPREWRETAAATSHYYDPADENRAGLQASRWIERCSDPARLVTRRRARYAQWTAALAGVAGVRPLLPELPAHVAPYMFPMLVDAPPRLFQALKRVGLPIWRWDEMAVSDCPVSRRYRQGVFHLSCHQSLTDAEMAWMTAAVRAAARRA